MLSLCIKIIIFSWIIFILNMVRSFQLRHSYHMLNCIICNCIRFFLFLFTFLLCPSTKLLKATISFATTVGPFFCPMVGVEQLESHWTEFHEI